MTEPLRFTADDVQQALEMVFGKTFLIEWFDGEVWSSTGYVGHTKDEAAATIARLKRQQNGMTRRFRAREVQS